MFKKYKGCVQGTLNNNTNAVRKLTYTSSYNLLDMVIWTWFDVLHDQKNTPWLKQQNKKYKLSYFLKTINPKKDWPETIKEWIKSDKGTSFFLTKSLVRISQKEKEIEWNYTTAFSEDKIKEKFFKWYDAKNNTGSVKAKISILNINKCIPKVPTQSVIPLALDQDQGGLHTLLGNRHFIGRGNIALFSDAGYHLKRINPATCDNAKKKQYFKIDSRGLNFEIGSGDRTFMKGLVGVDECGKGIVYLEKSVFFPDTPTKIRILSKSASVGPAFLGKFFGDFAQILYQLSASYKKNGYFGSHTMFATGDKMAAMIYLFMAEQLKKPPALAFESGTHKVHFYYPKGSVRYDNVLGGINECETRNNNSNRMSVNTSETSVPNKLIQVLRMNNQQLKSNIPKCHV